MFLRQLNIGILSVYAAVLRLYKKTLSTFIKNEALAEVFSCGFCEVFKNTFFTEDLQTNNSIHLLKLLLKSKREVNQLM